MNWEKVHEEDSHDGIYKFVLSITQCNDSIDWDFDTEEDRQRLIELINDGVFLWFDARVECSIDGHVFGVDYLSGCCYESIKDFINDPYYTDMKQQARDHSREVIDAIKKITKH